MPQPRTEPTEEQLRAAWRRLHRPEWGNASFEADKAAAVRWARVRLAALHPHAAGTATEQDREAAHAQALAQHSPAPPRPAGTEARPAPPRPAPSRATGIDLKRAAAGDRDDDEPTLL